MIEITTSHEATVGDITVRRALPHAGRRTVGAWCFADHMGPVVVGHERGLDVGPHPHMGLATATWLIEGRALHRDSLGNEQLLSTGELNLMTAGHGVAHSEEATDRYEGRLQGIQLWIALPAETRDGAAAFDHHASLPELELDGGTATVIIGACDGHDSPARADTPLVGIDLELRTTTSIALEPSFEHALVVLEGGVRIDGKVLGPGLLGYLGAARDELGLEVTGPARVMLLGGVPFPETIQMWWNFVGRSRREFIDAYRSWTEDDGRFGTVVSSLERVETTPPHPKGDGKLTEL